LRWNQRTTTTGRARWIPPAADEITKPAGWSPTR
jgi:hypothetical protein